MIKTYLLSIALLWSSTQMMGQFVPRYLLLEHFTNTRCSLCPSRNANLYAKLDNHPGKIHHLSIHPSVPYNNCALYQHNTSGNGVRQALYNVTFTPQSYLWGVKAYQGSDLMPTATLNNALGQHGSMQIMVDELTINENRGATVRIRSMEDIPPGDYRLYVAVAEKLISYNAPNGETEHHDVFRTMLPNDGGETFTPPAKGEEIVFSFPYTLDPIWDGSQVFVTAFVQEVNSKAILNSGTRFDLRTLTSSVPATNGTGSASVITQGGFPPYTYKWSDPAGQVTPTATGLAPGLYSITVQDSTGLQIQDTVRVDGTTGITEALVAKLQLYPQPAREVLWVQLADAKARKVQLKVLDIQGRLIKQETAASLMQAYAMDLSQLSPGLYVLELKLGSHSLRKKWIKK